MLQFTPIALHTIKDTRDKYFEEIQLSQELFLEWMVADGNAYEIKKNCKEIGYFITSKENILIEFYLIPEGITNKESIFGIMLKEYSIGKSYCKSFDSLLLICNHTYCKSSRIIGTLFRDYTAKKTQYFEENIRIRLAEEKDIPFLLTFDSELYETPEELHYTVSNKIVYMFENENKLIGCGYLIKILPHKNYYDIGMWTNPEFRKKGYAVKIISYLTDYCLRLGYIPVCGCAADNVASRKTLEKNGYISKYALIEFNF